MKLSTPLLATLACTQAICIEANADSQVDAEFFNDIADWASGVVNDIGDIIEETIFRTDGKRSWTATLETCAKLADYKK